MRPIAPPPQGGETLVALLVGLALGLGVLAVGAQMLARMLAEQRQLHAQSRLQQDRDRVQLGSYSGKDGTGLHRGQRKRPSEPLTERFLNGERKGLMSPR